jgi:sialidase-1
MQSGITLAFGKHQGRLILPARIMGPKSSNAVEWRPYHYSTALYSDDGGAIWQTSKPFPVLGTGEGTLAELSDGSILYNSREHMSRGNRFFAWSHDGGDLWLNAYRSPDLPDGARGTSYGLKAGMIRLPVPGHDILLYSNVDTDAGVMPARVGASIVTGREKITVWGSFDGGRSWPLKRLVYAGPSAYSNLGVGRSATASQGRIYLLFEGGPRGPHDAVQVVSFNLSWLLNGRNESEFLGKPRAGG